MQGLKVMTTLILVAITLICTPYVLGDLFNPRAELVGVGVGIWVVFFLASAAMVNTTFFSRRKE